jgi:hypothetical protein
VEGRQVKECCSLEDGAYLHSLVCFEDFENSMEDIVASFFLMLYLWTKAFLSTVSISFYDFLVRFSLPS